MCVLSKLSAAERTAFLGVWKDFEAVIGAATKCHLRAVILNIVTAKVLVQVAPTATSPQLDSCTSAN